MLGVDQELGTAAEVRQGGLVDVDPHVVIEGCEDLLKADRSLVGFSAHSVGRSDDLPRAHPSAGQEGVGHPRPVVPSRILVNGRRASKLAPCNHGRVVGHSALVQIFDQCRESLIEIGQVLLCSREVAPVPIPEAVAHRHYPRPGFDQPSGDEKLFVHARSSIALHLACPFSISLPNPWVFLAEVERFQQSARGQKIEGFLLEGVHALHHAAGVKMAPQAVEAP